MQGEDEMEEDDEDSDEEFMVLGEDEDGEDGT